MPPSFGSTAGLGKNVRLNTFLWNIGGSCRCSLQPRTGNWLNFGSQNNILYPSWFWSRVSIDCLSFFASLDCYQPKTDPKCIHHGFIMVSYGYHLEHSKKKPLIASPTFSRPPEMEGWWWKRTSENDHVPIGYPLVNVYSLRHWKWPSRNSGFTQL